jgi:hypothetical protein
MTCGTSISEQGCRDHLWILDARRFCVKQSRHNHLVWLEVTIFHRSLECSNIVGMACVCPLDKQVLSLELSKQWPNKVRWQVLVMWSSVVPPTDVNSDLLNGNILQSSIQSVDVGFGYL